MEPHRINLNSCEYFYDPNKPTGLLNKNVFGYSGGYSLATSIEPGKGYWVKANAVGTITLSSGSPEGKVSSLNSELKELNSITLRDAIGNVQVLYFGSGSLDVRRLLGRLVSTEPGQWQEISP